MAKTNDTNRGRHVVYNLNAHLVFVPKYRRKVLTARVFRFLEEVWRNVCCDFGAELRECGYESDHVHLLVFYPPKVALSVLVNSLKGVSARRLLSERFPEIKSKLQGPHFWSPSYCAVSCGGAPLAIVKRYVEAQRGSASSPP